MSVFVESEFFTPPSPTWPSFYHHTTSATCSEARTKDQPREINVESCSERISIDLGEEGGERTFRDSDVVREKLKRDDVEQTLKTIDGLGHSNNSVRISHHARIGIVRNDDRCSCGSAQCSVTNLD